jgi:hypothetical protein
MALTTLSVAFSILVLKVHYMSPNYAVPDWVRRLVLENIANVLYMKENDGPVLNSHVEAGVAAMSCHVGCRKSTGCSNASHRAIGELYFNCCKACLETQSVKVAVDRQYFISSDSIYLMN